MSTWRVACVSRGFRAKPRHVAIQGRWGSKLSFDHLSRLCVGLLFGCEALPLRSGGPLCASWSNRPGPLRARAAESDARPGLPVAPRSPGRRKARWGTLAS